MRLTGFFRAVFFSTPPIASAPLCDLSIARKATCLADSSLISSFPKLPVAPVIRMDGVDSFIVQMRDVLYRKNSPFSQASSSI